MILGKFWTGLRAAFNKLANLFYERDPIAVMQLEIDTAAQRLRGAREGVEQYRGLVERVLRQVTTGEQNAKRLETQIKAYLRSGAREMAAQLAVQLKATRDELAANNEQLKMHETAYKNHLLKLQQGNKDLVALQQKAEKYAAELKMSAAEAEIARVAEALGESLAGNLTTNLGQIESVIQRQIDQNRGKARVAADMSSKGVEEIKAQQAAESIMAEDILQQFEVEMGLKSAETTPVAESLTKDLGPASQKTTT